MNWFLRFFISFSIMTIGFNSLAQNEEGKKKKRNKKATIDFEDQLVEGEVKKPELFYLLRKKQFNYKKLLKLRKNFIPEMEKSAEDISILIDEDLELDN